MTEGEERREYIIQLLTQTKKPISGTELARQMKVSRQVIVQDIALLRASNRNILSTNKGYMYDRADEKKVDENNCNCKRRFRRYGIWITFK